MERWGGGGDGKVREPKQSDSAVESQTTGQASNPTSWMCYILDIITLSHTFPALLHELFKRQISFPENKHLFKYFVEQCFG